MPLRIPRTPPFISHPRRTPPPSPPVALTLVAGTYQPDVSVELTFERAVDVAGIDVSAFLLEDGAMTGSRYVGTGAATLISPAKVRVMLAALGDAIEPGIALIVSADSGIVAADDGGAWAGVTDQALPFG